MTHITQAEWQIGQWRLTGCKLGDGEILSICLPGFSLSAAWMAERYPRLWEGSTCYFLDWPGLNDDECTPFDLEIIREWIQNIASEKSWKAVRLVGHSFGARVAFKLLERMPECSSLVLIAPVVRVKILENFIHLLPSAMYQKWVSILLNPVQLIVILNFARKLKILNRQEFSFMKEFSYDATLNSYLIQYAKKLPELKVTRHSIHEAIERLCHCSIYLFESDKLCDNRFWIQMAARLQKCQVKVLKGGHFSKIS